MKSIATLTTTPTTPITPTTSGTQLKKILKQILIGIDRINISVPAQLHSKFIHRLYEDGKCYRSFDKGNDSIVLSTISNTEVKVTKPIKPINPTKKILRNGLYQRFYVEIYNTITEVFEYIKETLVFLCRECSLPVSVIKIKQLEVKYDFYSNSTSTEDLKANTLRLKRFINRHLVLKYSRVDSFTKIKTTCYFGRKANIRKGKKGTRTYVKNNKYIPGTTFFRLEFQYNAAYFRSKKITINDLPFYPLDFESFNHVNLWSDISDKGIKCLARAILKKTGVNTHHSGTNHPGTRNYNKYNKKLREKQSELTSLILKKANNQLKNVHEQFSAIKDLKKCYEFTMNHKQHFKVLTEDTQLILCHADIAYNQDRCSKRMVFCQG